MHMPPIGCHVSVAGGISNAVTRAVERGCECVQVFTTSPRAWRHQLHRPDEVSAFRAGVARHGIRPVVVHAIYLINLASEDPGLRAKSLSNLVETCRWAGEIGASTVVFHPGHCPETGMPAGLRRVADCLRTALKGLPPGVTLSLEMSSGGRTAVGAAAHFSRIFRLLRAHSRLRVWLDTAHAWGAGYDLSVQAGVTRLVRDFARVGGSSRISGVHANDTSVPLGSLRDRHDNIGEGRIGLEGFRLLVRHPVLRKLPFILETPGFDGLGPDKRNVDRLKKLLGKRG